jgi:hypothetical protein
MQRRSTVILRHRTIGTGWILNAGCSAPFFTDGALTIREAAMSATRILWDQIVIVLLIVFVGPVP